MKAKHMRKLLVAIATAGLLLTACNQKTTPEHEHVWDAGEVTKEPTCHSEGIKTFHCTVDGCNQTKTENIAMTAHHWDEGSITTEPTCSATGVKTYTCTNEGCGKTKTETLEKVEHNYVFDSVSIIPDLLTKGQEVEKCSMCNDTHTHDLVAHADFEEQYGHNEFSWSYGFLSSFSSTDEDLVPVALTKTGDAYKNEGVEVSKGHVKLNGHALLEYKFNSDEEKISVTANIEFAGKEDSSRVDAYYVLLSADGHVKNINKISKDAKAWEYQTQTADALELTKGDRLGVVLSGNVEGDLSITYTAKCVHVWDAGTVTKPATTEEAGVKTYKCILCNVTKTHEIPKIVPEVDPLEEYFDFSNKVSKRFENGIVGNTWTTDLGHTLHVEVTTPGTNIWEGGAFVNTGVNMVSGKTYHLSFEVSRLQEENFEIILQNKQWEETKYETLYTPTGLVEKDIAVTDKNAGTLWLYIQFGNVVNEVIITKLKVAELEVDPLEEYFKFTGKTENRFENGIVGNSWTTDMGHTLHVEVTTAGTNIWEGGVFVNTGVEMVAGKYYKATFEVARAQEEDFEIILQNKQWDEKQYKKLFSPLGEIEETFEVTSENAGTLWIYVQFGNAVNEVTVSKLKVEETTAPAPVNNYFVFNNENILYRRESTVVNVWVDAEDNHKAHMKVEEASDAAWKGGMFINTSNAKEVGKTYTVSFDVERIGDLGDFETEIQFINGQWGAHYGDTIFNQVGHIEVEITVTDENADNLWIYLACGNTQGAELVISNLLIVEG